MVIRNKIRSLFKEEDPLELPTEVESSKERLCRFGLDDTEHDDTQDDKPDENREESNSECTQSEVIPPSATTTSVSSFTNLFSQEKSVEFQTLFKDLIKSNKPIKRDYVAARIEKSAVLKHLCDKYTARQLADKVRTERNIAKQR